MDEKNYDKLNDFSCKLGHMTDLMELAEQMTAELVSGDVTDDKEKEQSHIQRIWSLITGIVDLQHQREAEFEDLLKKINV